MTLPVLQLREIPQDGLDLEAPLDSHWLRSVFGETGFVPVGSPAGQVTLRVDVAGRDVLLGGKFTLATETPCVRCLEQTQIEVRGEFRLALRPAVAARPTGKTDPEADLSPADLDEDVYVDDKIDLAHWVREQILLELPAHPKCPAGCEAPEVHAELPNPGAIDPRLAPLNKIVVQPTNRKKKEYRRGRSQA